MSGRIFTSADYAALKNAFRRACKQAGGSLASIAAMSRLGANQLSRFGDLNSDQFAACDVIIDVDSLAGEPVTVRAMAELLGYELVPLAAPVMRAQPGQHLAGLARESGDVISRYAAALADNKLTLNELAALEADLAELDAQVQSARATGRAMAMVLRGEA